jgi:hypothetical protein
MTRSVRHDDRSKRYKSRAVVCRVVMVEKRKVCGGTERVRVEGDGAFVGGLSHSKRGREQGGYIPSDISDESPLPWETKRGAQRMEGGGKGGNGHWKRAQVKADRALYKG